MSQDTWTRVDEYFNFTIVGIDETLGKALERSTEAGLPEIAVAPNQGKFLQMLARIQGARSILEIGTLGAYSTIWLARALPDDGRLVTLEADPKHAAVARKNIDDAGLGDRIELIEGAALDTLPNLANDDRAPFDLVFIDADKPNNPNYLQWAMKLTSPGSIIIVDNVIRDGKIADTGNEDPNVQGARETFDMVQRQPNLDATALQLVGLKGYDGMIIALVTG